MASSYFQRLKAEGLGFYQQLSRTQKWILGGTALIVLGALVGVSLWAQRPDWHPLYTDLGSQDAGQIVAYLKENQVPYQLQSAGEGAVIRVPARQVHELRLQMAAQGMPREGGVMGFELFDQDNSTMGMTSRVFDLNYQRALAGELARTMMQMEPIEKARVHLAIPPKQIFSALQDPPSASVTLKLKPMAQLDETQVRSLSKLVAGSVPGLEEANVTLADAQGNLLFDASMAEDSAQNLRMNREQIALQKMTEQEIRQNVERILSRVIGTGRVNVQVKARLNFDQEESVSKSFVSNDNPQGDNVRALRSEKETTESGAGTEALPGGIPGTDSNLPGYRQVESDNNASYERRDTTRNYEVPETQTTRVKDPGQIERLTLSVALDSQAPAINAPEGLDANDPLLQNFRNLAVAAAGLDLERGDTIAIYAMPFDNSAFEAQQAELQREEQMAFWTRAALLGVVGLALLLIMLGFWLAWLRYRRLKVEAEALEAEDTLLLSEEDELPSLEPMRDPELVTAAARRAQAVRSLSEMAREDPAQMARMLRLWMQENKS